MWGIQSIMASKSNTSNPGPISNSRRPVSGISVKETATPGTMTTPDQGYLLPVTSSFGWAQLKDLTPDPSVNMPMSGGIPAPDTSLDFVGRNHGGGKRLGTVTGNTGSISGWDMRTSNFLYLDGHVETKNVADTVYPIDQWGAKFYSLPPY
jgi:prepilin-type processing-associated H-X9-DG protein